MSYSPAANSTTYKPIGLARLLPFVRSLLRLPGLRALRPPVEAAMQIAQLPSTPEGLRLPSHPSPQTPESLTLLSANLWHDWPKYRRLQERLEAFAQLVECEGADVLLLQEVARTPQFWADRWLAERLGMAYYYVRANGDFGTGQFEEGVAVFSRYPLSAPQVREMAPESTTVVRRMALAVRVHAPFGDFTAVSTHLAVPLHTNAAQLTHLRAWVAKNTGELPALIGGDFNVGEETPQIQATRRSWLDLFRRQNPNGDGNTHAIRLPFGLAFRRKRLDYIFLRPAHKPWPLLDARHLDAPGQPHSDHRISLARLAVPIP